MSASSTDVDVTPEAPTDGKPKKESKEPAKEPFLPNYRQATDPALLAPPAEPVTPATLFVCTYEAALANLHTDFKELGDKIARNLRGAVLAINSNFVHAALPGYERYLKLPKKEPEPKGPIRPARGRARKVQGDGTCFNSAIELVIRIEHPELAATKIHKVKCFPTTGQTQVPGTLLPDYADGHAALLAFTGYLNELGAGDADSDGIPQPVAVDSEEPNMLNYKFRVNRSCPRMLVNLHRLAAYLLALEKLRLTAASPRPLQEAEAREFACEVPLAVVLPPFRVRAVKAPTDDVKVSFLFSVAGSKREPRVNVFQEGKINILGAKTSASAAAIYDYFRELMVANWAALVTLQPKRDNERAAARPPDLDDKPAAAPRAKLTAPRAPAAFAVAPGDLLDDDEVDALLSGEDLVREGEKGACQLDAPEMDDIIRNLGSEFADWE